MSDQSTRELKLENAAYRERIAELTTEYEQKIARLRVQFTLLAEQINAETEPDEVAEEV